MGQTYFFFLSFILWELLKKKKKKKKKKTYLSNTFLFAIHHFMYILLFDNHERSVNVQFWVVAIKSIWCSEVMRAKIRIGSGNKKKNLFAM